MSDNKKPKKPAPKPPTGRTVKGDGEKLNPTTKSKGNPKK